MSLHYLTYLLEKFRFYKIIIARFFIILFKNNKEIELLCLDYNTEHLFHNSFILINYSFKNAIYYKFGKNKTLEKEIKIFNLTKIEDELILTVYGFFRKKIFKIILNPKLILDKSSFETEFSKLKIVVLEVSSIRIIHSDKIPKINNLRMNFYNVEIENKKLIVKTNSFNQNEFI